MNRRLLIPAAALLLTALLASAAPVAADARGAAFAPGQVLVRFEGQRLGRTIKLPPRVGVREAARALGHSPGIAYAVPDYIATASADPVPPAPYVPDDTGLLTGVGVSGDWAAKQWNFLPWESSGNGFELLPVSPGGIDAPQAWRNLIEAGRPGAEGVTVAVLDSGIAYRGKGKDFRRSPDFSVDQFVKGYDFVADNRQPLDYNGHGTVVAGTIAEKTDNAFGLTGLAYRARLMPVRVLNRHGEGLASEIAKGVRFAVAHGANVINMSFNFECGEKVPEVNSALSKAYEKGVVTVASVGNRGSDDCVSAPANGPHVIGVGGTTEGGCLGQYSVTGKYVDVVAPGGGVSNVGCTSVLSRPIYQVTFKGRSKKEFGLPGRYVGTSMAAAHASAVVAMILAANVIVNKAKPSEIVDAVTERLGQTARSIGLPKNQQGAGLIDAAEATNPAFKPAGPATAAAVKK